jgi:hypothetical protein
LKEFVTFAPPAMYLSTVGERATAVMCDPKRAIVILHPKLHGLIFRHRGQMVLGSEPKRFVHQDCGDPARGERLVDDEDVIHSAGNAVGLPGPPILKR